MNKIFKALFCQCQDKLKRMTEQDLTQEELELVKNKAQEENKVLKETYKWKCPECQKELIGIDTD